MDPRAGGESHIHEAQNLVARAWAVAGDSNYEVAATAAIAHAVIAVYWELRHQERANETLANTLRVLGDQIQEYGRR